MKMKTDKCMKCAELETCHCGKYIGKQECKCFCPCYYEKDKKRLIHVTKAGKNKNTIINGFDGEILLKETSLDARQIMQDMIKLFNLDVISIIRKIED